MASVYVKRWTSRGPDGHRAKHGAWGFTLMVNDTQERKFDAAWTRETAQAAPLSR